MDNYWSRPPKVFTYIKVIFYLLMGIISISLLLVFVLKINESVGFKKGEIFSHNSPIEYRAAYEAKVKEIRGKEGDAVQQGDTLMLLFNDALAGQYQEANESYLLSLSNISLYQKQLDNLETKIAEMKDKAKIIKTKFRSNTRDRKIEISALEQQVELMKENLNISEEQLEKDKQLLSSGAMSQLEYQTNYQKHLEKLNELTDLQKQYRLQLNSKSGLANDYSGEATDLRMQVLADDFEYVKLKKELLEEQSQNQKTLDQLALISNELEKLVITAGMDGYISRLFNTKKEANFVAKGTPLVTIHPGEEESFYAKVSVPQESISKVDTGQVVHFRLDAYNFYQYGILEGRVEYISRQDTTKDFYLVADIIPNNPSIEVKSGYKVKGDIILREVRLYRFILNRLFRKMNT